MSGGAGPAAPGARGAGRIRPAHERDLDRLAALFSLLLEHHAAAGARFRARRGSDDALRAWLGARLRERDTVVLVHETPDGNLPALCLASLRTRPALFEETRRGEIEHLVVRPEARRRGLARGLVLRAQAWLAERGAARVELCVDRANAEGRAFWSALGYDPAMDVLERRL